MKIGYVVSQYPAVSHTFIQREIAGVTAAGIDVQPFSIHRTASSGVLSTADADSHEQTIALRPVSLSRLLVSHVRVFARNPRAYVTTLRKAIANGGRDPRRAIYQLFYFAEAVLLWNAARPQSLDHL